MSTIKRITSPAPREEWNEILQLDPAALVTQSPDWVDCLCKYGGYQDASRLYEMQDGRRFVMPMVRREILPHVFSIEASLPNAWGFGGLIGSEALGPQDVAAIIADISTQNSLQVMIRPNPLHGNIWDAGLSSNAIRIPRLAHVLELEADFPTIWEKRFEHRTRWAVRKAERSSLTIECDTTGRLVPLFHKLLTRSFDRWASQQHEPAFLTHWRGWRRDPLRKFQIMAETLGDACRVWVAWLYGEPVAALLILQGANAHASRSAMNREMANKTQAGVLLERLAIEDACQAGCRYYHLGESGLSERLDMYKRQFGALPHPYAEYRIERFPLTQVDRLIRSTAKKVIGFRDT